MGYVDWEKKTITVKGCGKQAEKDFCELTEEWMRSIDKEWMESKKKKWMESED